MISFRRNKFLIAIGIISVIALIIKALIPQPDVKQKIDSLRKKTTTSLDSLNKYLVAEKKAYDSIKYLISSGHWVAADNIVNQLLEREPRNDRLLILKAKIFATQKQYDSALYYCDYAIAINPSSDAGIEKAKILIKIRKYPEAIAEYKKAFDVNYDFSYSLAIAFELNNQKDSALKYYNIYLEHYPDSLAQQLNQQGIYVVSPDSVKIRIKNLKG
ncbi:MAG TPA: tetratricopeptide repeat protein [Puia sp.]|nr:tetratricopeptide repeat protein [Puia sp.]